MSQNIMTMIVDLGVSFLEKCTKSNTPSIKNSKCLTSDELEPLLSVKRNQQVA